MTEYHGKSRFDRLGLHELASIRDRFSFEGKKALITGAAGGFGYSVAAALAELGADVALVDLKGRQAGENAKQIAARFGRRAIALEADLSNPAAVSALFQSAADELGGLDAVHSNAGSHMSEIDNGDMPPQKWKQLVAANYTSMFLVNQAACNWMRDNHRPGALVNTASISGHIVNRGARHSVCYSSTKAAVLQMTKAFAMDYAQYGIRVNSVSPGVFVSGLHDNLVNRDAILTAVEKDVPLGRLGNLNELNGLVAFLLSDLATYITGADMIVDGGYTDW